MAQAPGVVVALRPGSRHLEDVHGWLAERLSAGAESLVIVVVNSEKGDVELREFGEEMGGSVMATVALIVQARALREFTPVAIADDEDG